MGEILFNEHCTRQSTGWPAITKNTPNTVTHNVEVFFSLFKHSESNQSRLIWWQSSAGYLGFSLVAFHTLGYWSKMAHQDAGPAWGKPVRGHVFFPSLQGQGLGLP